MKRRVFLVPRLAPEGSEIDRRRMLVPQHVHQDADVRETLADEGAEVVRPRPALAILLDYGNQPPSA